MIKKYHVIECLFLDKPVEYDIYLDDDEAKIYKKAGCQLTLDGDRHD